MSARAMTLEELEIWLSGEIDKLGTRTNHTLAVAVMESQTRLMVKLVDVRLARLKETH